MCDLKVQTTHRCEINTLFLNATHEVQNSKGSHLSCAQHLGPHTTHEEITGFPSPEVSENSGGRALPPRAGRAPREGPLSGAGVQSLHPCREPRRARGWTEGALLITRSEWGGGRRTQAWGEPTSVIMSCKFLS